MFRSAPRKRKRQTTTKPRKKGRRRSAEAVAKAANAATALANKVSDELVDLTRPRTRTRNQRSSTRKYSDEDYCTSEEEEEQFQSVNAVAAEPEVFMATFMMSSRTSIGLNICDGSQLRFSVCVQALFIFE